MKAVYDNLRQQINPSDLEAKMNKQKDKLGQHPDLVEFRFVGVPLVIFGNKFDKYTELEPSIKRNISIMLRSYAHCFGANLFCSSSAHHHPQCARKVRDLIQNFIYDEEFMNVKIKTKDYYIRPFFIKHGTDSIKDLEVSLKSHNPLSTILYEKYRANYGEVDNIEKGSNVIKPKFDQYPEKEIDLIRDKKNRELQQLMQFKKSFMIQKNRESVAEKEEIRQSMIESVDHNNSDEYKPSINVNYQKDDLADMSEKRKKRIFGNTDVSQSVRPNENTEREQYRGNGEDLDNSYEVL